MVERKVKPTAAIDSSEQLQRLKERGFQAIDEIRATNADKDPEQIDRDVTAAVEAVRQERYEERRRPTRKNGRRHQPVL